MARKKLNSATDQRKFTIVYNDFLESDLLDKHEKLIFIAIKKFADNDTMRAFPSLKTLHRMTGISIRWIKKSIEHMEQIGVISVEHREDDEKGHQSNLYTLYDYAEVWKVGSSEDVAAVADEVSEMKLVAELRARGYTVTKEKELESEPTKAQTQAPQFNQFDMVNTTINSQKSQEVEQYSLDKIKEYYNYDVIVNDRPTEKASIDSIMSILEEVLNTTLSTIRIGKEEKQSKVVISKLKKLTYLDIIYVIDKFSENKTERVKNIRSYMLTLLFRVDQQRTLDILNQVQCDMNNWDLPTE